MEPAETDLELLEAYLDGELPPEQLGQLRLRLAAEPVLIAALDQLRSQRALRMQVWRQMEPETSVAEDVLSRLHASSSRPVRSRSWRVVQYISAAAACIVVGFTVGWIGRGRTPVPADMAGTSVNPGGMQFVNQSAAPRFAAPGSYQVVVTDDAGHPVAVRKFNSLEDARRFIDQSQP